MIRRPSHLSNLIAITALLALVPIQPVTAAAATPLAARQSSVGPDHIIYGRPDGTQVVLPGFGLASLSAPASCSTSAPSLTYPINGNQINTLSPDIQWNGTGTDSYYLQLSTASNFSTFLFNNYWGSYHAQLYFDLSANTTYYWRLASACGFTSYGSFSSTASFHIGNVTGPFQSPPPMSSPADGAYFPLPSNVTFSWGNDPGAIGYMLRTYSSLAEAQNDTPQNRQLTWNGSWGPWMTSTMGYFDTAGIYYWRVVAQSATGWGPLSPIRSIVVGGLNPLVREARLDLGMPYDTNRGCGSPYSGCGGPYHGFDSGVCTDLVLDAYTAGGPFNLQAALSQDALVNQGRYRWADARNADDLRRYFVGNQQFLANNQAYQAGDIAFFDWNGDGVTDHVLIVGTVDSNGRPLEMEVASGSYSGNPNGRAFEHSWNSYYDQHVQGHGRVNGIFRPSAPSAAGPLQVLQVSIDSEMVGLRLVDAKGKSTSTTYDENLVASNVDAFIPYIPGGVYTDTGTERVITVTQPLSDTGQYVLELHGLAGTTYHLAISTLQNSSVTTSRLFTPTIGLGETDIVSISLSAPGGSIQFAAQSPVVSAAPAVPDGLALSGLVNTSIHGTMTVTEAGGQQNWSGVAIIATNMTDQLGGVLPSSRITLGPSNYTVTAGHSQTVTVDVDITNVPPGEYLGSLTLTSQNADTRTVPLAVTVVPHSLYLPLVSRN